MSSHLVVLAEPDFYSYSYSVDAKVRPTCVVTVRPAVGLGELALLLRRFVMIRGVVPDALAPPLRLVGDEGPLPSACAAEAAASLCESTMDCNRL